MQNAAIEMFYLFFQGVLTFQSIFFGVLYFIVRRKDLLYYSLFLFFAAAYFFINAPNTFFGILEEIVWNSTWYDYVNTPAIIIENLFYLLFLKAFFEDITKDKTVSRIFKITLWLIPFLFVLFTVLTIFQINKQLIFYTVKLITIIPAIAVAYIVLKRKLPFSSLMANGLLCTIAGTVVTVTMIVLRNYQVHHLFTDSYPLLFIRLGILGDMIFFQAAILKKWHYQEKQLAIEKVKSELAVEHLRNKISSELHDDLGSTLSGISMYSFMANELLESGEYEKAKQSLGIIQKSANEMASNLSDLVWTINPKQDSFEILLDRLKEYGTEICAAKLITFNMLFSDTIFKNTLSMEHRHQIYLLIKEAINNAVKYSGASAIEMKIDDADGKLKFAVNDNGSGFDPELARSGNGLLNMKRRADEIGATLIMQSNKNLGTFISLQCKIT